MFLTGPSRVKDESLQSSLEQIHEAQPTLVSIEEQLQKLRADLPSNPSRTLLQARAQLNDLQARLKHVSPDSARECTEIEGLNDMVRRMQWKISERIKEKMDDIFIQCTTSREDEEKTQLQTSREIYSTLNDMKQRLQESFTKEKEKLESQETKMSEIVLLAKSKKEQSSSLVSQISSDISLQNDQINDLTKEIEKLPDLIKKSKAQKEQPIKKKEVEFMNKKADLAKLYDIPDLSAPLSALQDEFQTMSLSLENDLANVSQRNDLVNQSLDKQEQTLSEIADKHTEYDRVLNNVYDNVLDLMDKADDTESVFSGTKTVDTLAVIETEARETFQEIRRDLSIIKSRLNQQESEITNSY